MKYKSGFLYSLNKEIELQKKYLGNDKVQTIYLGGGTPSLLSESELSAIFENLYKNFEIDPEAEITLEANPDDLDEVKIRELARSKINRLSIGIQSFFDEDLKYLNRVHSAKQAKHCIQLAQDSGFSNLTIDLIYGIPSLSDTNWIKNLETFISFRLPHLSAYALTVEPRTALDVLIQKKKMKPVDDDHIINQFNLLMEFAEQRGYIHYEISNYCLKSHFSKHNTNYWKGEKYLGLGPSAHSYNRVSRQWNIANVQKYIDSIGQHLVPSEKEVLTIVQQFNEYIMLSLRTMWGIDTDDLDKLAGESGRKHFMLEVKSPIEKGLVINKGNKYMLTRKGKAYADGIAADLFL